jgi:hypothetical protein
MVQLGGHVGTGGIALVTCPRIHLDPGSALRHLLSLSSSLLTFSISSNWFGLSVLILSVLFGHVIILISLVLISVLSFDIWLLR